MSSSEQFPNPSEAAKRLGVCVKALRLYEQRGLIAPIRTAAGWRVYGPEEMGRAGGPRHPGGPYRLFASTRTRWAAALPPYAVLRNSRLGVHRPQRGNHSLPCQSQPADPSSALSRHSGLRGRCHLPGLARGAGADGRCYRMATSGGVTVRLVTGRSHLQGTCLLVQSADPC